MAKYKHTVFVVEDDAAVCESLRWLFESVNLSTEIFNNGFDYLKAHNPTRSGCLLIDIRLPDISGLELQQQLVQLNNPIPIIIITGHGDVALAVRAMKAGAKDFIVKPYNNEILLEQVQKAILESSDYNLSKKNFLDRLAQLTTRENEILQLVIEGKLNKQIAAELNISNSTVEKHRSHLMDKMQTRSVAKLIKQYILATHDDSKAFFKK
jgi:two-component system response regulator FixJ